MPTKKAADREKKFEYTNDTAKWAALVQLWDKETDRFWVRNNVFLLLNGGLIALFSTPNFPPFVGLVGALIGIVVTIIWHRVNRISKFYMDRWKDPIKKIEAGWSIAPIALVDGISGEHRVPRKFRKTTAYMQAIVRLYTLFWAVVFIRHFGLMYPTVEKRVIEILTQP